MEHIVILSVDAADVAAIGGHCDGASTIDTRAGGLAEGGHFKEPSTFSAQL